MKEYHDDDKHNCSDCPFSNMCGNPRAWFVEGILNKGLENKVEV